MTPEEKDARIAEIAEVTVPKLYDQKFGSLAFFGRGIHGLEAQANIRRTYDLLDEVGDLVERLHFILDQFERRFFLDFLWFWFCFTLSIKLGGTPHHVTNQDPE